MDKNIKDITIRQGQPEDAPVIASLIMEAMSEECCQYYYGENHTAADFHAMMTDLARQENSQYSYINTLVATDSEKHIAGICVSYDGKDILRLRQQFINETKKRFGRDFSDMPEETEAGELYIDSMAVMTPLRGKGIGKQLFKAAEERARRLGINTLGLLVDRANPNAERLYRSIGYSHVDDKDWGGHILKHMQKNI